MTIKKRLILMFAPTIIILLALLTIYTQYIARKEAVNLAYTTALSIAADQSSTAMTRIQNVESYLIGIAGEISDKLSEKQPHNHSELTKRLLSAKTHDNAPPFFGIGLVLPALHNGDIENRAYKGYFSLNEKGENEYAEIKENIEEQDYFKYSYNSGKTFLTDAYRDSAGTLLISFSVPIKVKEKVIGVLFANIKLDTLSAIILDAVIPYDGGYAFISTETGVVVAHPKKNNLLKNLKEFNSVDKTKIADELKTYKPIREQGVQSNGVAVLNLIYPFKVTSDPTGKPWYFGVIIPKNEVMADSNANLYKTIAISIIGVIIALFITFWVANNIANSVQRISHFSAEISEGNYDATVSTKGFTKELIALKDSLTAMVTSLLATMEEATHSKTAAEEGLKKAEIAMAEAEIAKNEAEASQRSILEAAENIENVSSRLSAAAEQLSAQVEESSRSADRQREQVGVSVTAMEQMNTTILDVAQNASSASEGSQKTKERAEEGAKIVKDSISAIEGVETNINILQEEMGGLKNQAESIGAIMTVISDIADQTNLLALNAAIEAARAGEAGRGFAVVADEVRKLAEKTMSATGEVGQAITGIQNGMTRSVGALEVTTTNLSKSTELVSNSENSLASIVEYALISAEQISSIATAVEEQSASCHHINESLSDINRISDEVATVMNESSQAVMDLSRQASELEELVAHLRDQ